MNEAPLFVVDSVVKTFGDRRVLKNASVWAWSGKVTAVLGRNGCGKSTLLKIATGLMQGEFGTVRMGGEVYEKPRLHNLARHGLYYMPDRGGMPLDLTLRELLRITTKRFHTMSSIDAAEVVGLTPLIDTPVVQLSGGEQKRAEAALAIARRPTCLLTDEPFAGISPIDAEKIANAFRMLCENGCAIILTGHEVPNILDIADEIVWMVAGTTHALGTTKNALKHDQFCREYLGTRVAHHA